MPNVLVTEIRGILLYPVTAVGDVSETKREKANESDGVGEWERERERERERKKEREGGGRRKKGERE